MTVNNGMRPVHPGEILRDELQALGLSGQCVVQAPGCAGEPDHGDPARAARRDRQHGTPAGALFRDDAAGLAEPAKTYELRPSGDSRGPPNRRRCEAPHTAV